MEHNFNQNDFEEFLQDQVKNHRMYPADAVWRDIDKKLHGDKRWPALTIAALLLLSATVLICVYFTPKPNIFSLKPANINTSTHQTSRDNNILNNISASGTFGQEKTKYPLPSQNAVPIPLQSISTASSETEKGSTTDDLAVEKSNGSPSALRSLEVPKISNAQNIVGVARLPKNEVVSSNKIPDATSLSLTLASNGKIAVSNKAKEPAVNASTKDYNDKNVADNFLKEHQTDVPLFTGEKKVFIKNRFSYQIYVAPSVSYRKLLEDNSMVKVNNGGPVGLNYVTDVNKVVRHRPGTGIEVGISFMYNLTSKVRVKTGFQFNMRQYSIEAYRSSTELASIALMTGSRIDTITTLSMYRNNNGYSSAELVNRYYQLSMPLGIEWEVLGNKRVHLNIAATIQPTYLLNRNAYLLSTNFKNYTESPGMVRQWNINSNIETFISFKVGDFKWQLGPQLRYQPYSTFIPEYTIKEHLLDYGLKLGVSHILK